MTSPLLAQTATAALAELLEVSPQVDAAVVFERSGSKLLAHAPEHAEDRTRRFADVAARILEAAERARTELGREPVTQCEVATGEGHVFVVADAGHVVAAVTAADPTVGLVFYDLKTALRAVRDQSTQQHARGGLPASTTSGAPASLATAPAVVVESDGSGGSASLGTSDGDDGGDGDEYPNSDVDGLRTSEGDDAGEGSSHVGTGRFRRRKQ